MHFKKLLVSQLRHYGGVTTKDCHLWQRPQVEYVLLIQMCTELL